MPSCAPNQIHSNDWPPHYAFEAKRRGRYARMLLRPRTAALPIQPNPAKSCQIVLSHR